MNRVAIALALVLLALEARVIADDVLPPPEVPTCTNAKIKGRRIATRRLRYVVPKNAVVKKIKDVDYAEYRVFLEKNGRWEALHLFSWGNGTPDSLCSAAPSRPLQLPDGTKGHDARCTKVEKKESRSTGFPSEYAYYDSASPESAKYFDAIIESMCYAPRKK